MINNDKKVAVVTGGAQGIGKSISLKLFELGYKLNIVDVSEEAARKTAEEIQGNYYIVNVADSAEVKNTVQKIIEKDSKIDILINNAGITRDALLIRMTDENWQDVIDVNLKGVFNFSREIVKGSMIKNRTGNIVNIASIVGITGNPGQANYSASKAGVIAITKTFAKELAKRGIRVNAIAPGFIRTKMTDKLPDEVKAKFLENIPLGRLGEASEIAETVSFLISEKSSYITGQVIVVDGGMVM